MIRILLLLLLVATALIAGPILAGNKGYVLIALGHYTIEMTVVSTVLLAILLYAALMLTETLLSRLFNLRNATHGWLRRRRQDKAAEQTLAGTLALIEGKFHQAETLMNKGAHHSTQPLINYLTAAEAAEAQGEALRAESYLEQAANEYPQATLAVGLLRARLQLRTGQPAAAETTLLGLAEHQPNHPVRLLLLKEAYQRQGRWRELFTLLPQLRKYKALPAAELANLEQAAYPPLLLTLAQEEGATALGEKWRQLSKAQQQDPAIRTAAVQAWLSLGDESTARALLQGSQREALNEDLLTKINQLQQPAPDLLVRLRKQEQETGTPSARVLLAIGHLLTLSRDFVTAQQYLERSVAVQAMPEALQALARLMEQQRLFEKASDYYRRSLNG